MVCGLSPAEGGTGPPGSTIVLGGGAQVRDSFLLVPLISHCFHASGFAKQPASTRTREGMKGPLMALPDFLGPRRSSVGRKFPKGQQVVLETVPSWDAGGRGLVLSRKPIRIFDKGKKHVKFENYSKISVALVIS